MRAIAVLMMTGVLVLASACSDGGRDPAGEASGNHAVTPAADGDSGAQPAADHAHEAEGEGEALLPIMQRLGSLMTTITYGLMTDNDSMVARSATAIAAHAPIAQEDLERIHGILGDEMAEFERLDLEVHDQSVLLSEAAAAGQTDEVLTQLNTVQRGCIACHSQFRARLLTNPVPQ